MDTAECILRFEMEWPLELQSDYIKRVDKVWGRERWIVNNEQYCAKILDICCSRASSLHYHPVKDETFHVLEGTCCLEIRYLNAYGALLAQGIFTLRKGDTIRIKPRTAHRFYCTPDMTLGCKVLEVSTPHSDDDVVRLEESKCLS